MLTGPVAAARAAVATGAWVKSKHMYLIRGSKCGSLSFISTHPPEDLKKKKKRKKKKVDYSICQVICTLIRTWCNILVPGFLYLLVAHI